MAILHSLIGKRFKPKYASYSHDQPLLLFIRSAHARIRQCFWSISISGVCTSKEWVALFAWVVCSRCPRKQQPSTFSHFSVSCCCAGSGGWFRCNIVGFTALRISSGYTPVSTARITSTTRIQIRFLISDISSMWFYFFLFLYIFFLIFIVLCVRIYNKYTCTVSE